MVLETSVGAQAPARLDARPRLPLPGWVTPAMLFASLCITCGVLWDISWHETIGRDTFWTPAHLAIHLGGSTGGILGGWLALDATFLRPEAWRGRSVRIAFGQAPLGAWVAAWGAVAMLTSAPFDNWWHDAYGLDVKILSPPHMLLALGMYSVVTGALLLTASRRNQLNAAAPATGADWQIIAAKGIQLALAAIMLTELSFPNLQHGVTFFYVSAALYPAALVSSASDRGIRWPATKVALVFMAVNAGMHWLLPLFSAEPRLAPIFNRVDHMVALPFPLLLFAPALALDVLFARWGGRPAWKRDLWLAGVAGALFLAVFVPVQWYFSGFMVSPAADNWFFGGHGRFLSYGDHRERGQEVFWPWGGAAPGVGSMLRIWGVATVSAWLGRRAGLFAAKVQR